MLKRPGGQNHFSVCAFEKVQTAVNNTHTHTQLQPTGKQCLKVNQSLCVFEVLDFSIIYLPNRERVCVFVCVSLCMLVPYVFSPSDHVISHQSASVPVCHRLKKTMRGAFNKALTAW